MAAEKKKKFFKKSRAEAAKLLIDGGKKSFDVAVEHEAPVGSVYGWAQKARTQAASAVGSKPASDDEGELKRLQRANKELRFDLTSGDL